MAEAVRELIAIGTNEGLAAARERGRVGGHPSVATEEVIRAVRDLLRIPGRSITSIAKLLGISPGTLYNHIPDLRELRVSGRAPPDQRADEADRLQPEQSQRHFVYTNNSHPASNRPVLYEPVAPSGETIGQLMTEMAPLRARLRQPHGGQESAASLGTRRAKLRTRGSMRARTAARTQRWGVGVGRVTARGPGTGTLSFTSAVHLLSDAV
ncbi:hypothetical protein [Streptomyces sp. NPDC002853]